jgi:hypothetical protein
MVTLKMMRTSRRGGVGPRATGEGSLPLEVASSVRAFARRDDLDDDQTMVALRRNP